MASITDVFNHLLFAWLYLFQIARFIPDTIASLISQSKWNTLFSLSEFRDANFGNFWKSMGPMIKSKVELKVVPLLEGRVHNGEISHNVLNRPVSGRVLEIGAGTGQWADVFLKINTTRRNIGTEDASESSVRKRVSGSGITKIYGVEPNASSVKALQKRIEELEMEDIYEAVPVGIEQLDDPVATGSATTIEPGSIDCIVSILCLCSIPDQDGNIKALYRLLRPGGRWYVYEHVKVKQGRVLMSLYQRYVNVFWALFAGSCRLCNDTASSLKKAGPWSEIDLVQPPDEPAYKMLPHVIGVLTK